MSTEDGSGTPVVPAKNVTEYFRTLLGDAQKNQRVSVEEPTEFYLVNLLPLPRRGRALRARPVGSPRG